MLAALLCAFSAAPQQPLDLAADRARQVLVDREEGQYLGHVSTVLLEDGKTILAVYPKGHGMGAIVYKRSEDGGRTWSERLPTPENWVHSKEVPTIHRVVDRDGVRRLILWSGLYPAMLAHSDDDGRTWSSLEPAGHWGGIVVMGDVIATKTKGRYLAFFHDDGRFLRPGGRAQGVFTLLQTASDDGGLTWSEPRELWSGSDVHLCEPGIVRSPDGKELAMLLRENARRQPSHVMFSTDEGEHWTQPKPMHPSLSGDRHTLRYAKDGRLVSVHRDMRLGDGIATKGDFVAWVGRYEDLREGTGGQYHVRLLDNQNAWDCGYPGLEVLPDGTFVATTYGHWEKGRSPYILSVRFALAELDAMALAQRPADPKAQDQQGDELREAVDRLEAYRPAGKPPTDPQLLAAERKLMAAMPGIVRRGGALAERLSALHALRPQQLTPSEERKITNRDPLARVLVRFDDERTLTTPVDFVRPHAAAASFPGALPQGAAPSPAGRTLALDVPGRRSLGLYAPAGGVVTVVFGDGKAQPPEGLRLRIGAHSDDVRRRDSWSRMPRISRVFGVDAATMRVASAYGGLLYLEADAGLSGTADLQVDGCVEAPLFELGTTDPQRWRDILRLTPGPWAELATQKVVLTVPSEAVRKLDDPTAVLQFWDSLLDGAADLSARPRERTRPERYVADRQISAGAMHAGYPIMTHLRAAQDMLDLQRMKSGPWGLLHELGHNHQSKDWTFDGTGEVTVNLFSLYLCDTLCGIGPDEAWGGNLRRAKDRLAQALAEGRKPWGERRGDKADFGVRLLMYSQLQQAFGWELFIHCFAEYRDLRDEERPKTDQDKRDQWLVRASRSVDRDLGPFFTAWGVETSDAARASVAALADWMPEDWPASAR